MSKKPCIDFAPATFTGHWREWHRGHGCELDDGRPAASFDHSRRVTKHFEPLLGYCVCVHCATLPTHAPAAEESP